MYLRGRFPYISFLKDYQILRAFCQIFKAVFPDHNHILNPDPESFFQVDSGFYGDDNARDQAVGACLLYTSDAADE